MNHIQQASPYFYFSLYLTIDIEVSDLDHGQGHSN